MGIKDKVKHWFIGSIHTQESLVSIENLEQFKHVLKSGCSVIFTIKEGYGLILFEEAEQLGIVHVKDAFGVHEDYRKYYSLTDLAGFFQDHMSEGISFYLLNS